MWNVAIVSAEQLVAAIPRQHDGHVLSREPRYVPCRNRRRVGERLVELFDQVIENRHPVRLDDELVMIGSEVRGNAARVFELVERRLVESDRERLDLLAGGLGHQANHQARIDPTR